VVAVMTCATAGDGGAPGARRLKPLDLDQRRSLDRRKKWRMEFDPIRTFKFLEAAGITTIILSFAMIGYVVLFR